jgi:ribosomal protein S20
MNTEDNKEFFNNFLSRIKSENIKKLWLEDKHFREKFFDYIYKDIYKIDQLNILELGVHAGYSTSLFLDVCKLNNGKLYSVDVNDYSKSFNDPNWTFIKSRDDNFDYIEKFIPEKVDVILIDTLHKANHVEKILYNYYPKLKKDGLIIVDDVSWLYYTKNSERDNFFREINNKETFFKLIDIYNSNKENINLEFNFAHSGVSKIKKKNNLTLNKANKIKSRTFTLMNLIKKILGK